MSMVTLCALFTYGRAYATGLRRAVVCRRLPLIICREYICG